jgi:hypothetical protein
MKLNGTFYFACAMLAILPGCGRLIDWGKETLNQGQEADEINKRVRDYIRSIKVYDQFTTRGIFDAIWLGDEIRTAYADLYAFRQGKSDEHTKTFLRRQLEENKHFISFYVLSLFEVPLGEANSEWNLILKINDAEYVPCEVKKIELPHEYRIFFGDHYTRFKEPYIVKFNAKDVEDNFLISPTTQKIELLFRAVDRRVVLCWQLDDQGNVIGKPKLPALWIKTDVTEADATAQASENG